MLQNVDGGGDTIPASTYHAVIEACCAGKVERHNNKKYNKNNSSSNNNKSAMDKINEAADLLTPWERRLHHMHMRHLFQDMRVGAVARCLPNTCGVGRKFGSSDDKDNAVPSLNVYQTVLIAFVEAGEYDHMNSLLTRMRRRGVRPTVFTYNSLLKICAQTARWREAVSILSQCQREPGVNPDLVTFTSTIRACARARKTDKAMEIFRVVKDMGVKMDVYCYTTAMDACAKGRRWKVALSLLDEMKEKGIEPNEVSYGVAVSACGNGGQWEKALELLEQMRKENMKINTITYNSAIAALAKAARSESRQQRRYDYKPGGGWSKVESSNPAYNDTTFGRKL
ncbi:pentatricopeptide repeat-containing protein [Skeletonema marinoi]|uniref:Pentatricopeptide repeat-containing protein n=1 Tax=Skeletonema marinoi TaxID=267567 RepID=A0AAD8YLG5_9STRA|nr:pentatricopeptide repeat-containing protein [Skeletonema marinoi]